MKKSLLIIGLSFVGFLGFAQQNNAKKTALLHTVEKNQKIRIENIGFAEKIKQDNVLIISEVDGFIAMEEAGHELMHNDFKFEGDSFDYREGTVTYKEYAINFEPDYLNTLQNDSL